MATTTTSPTSAAKLDAAAAFFFLGRKNKTVLTDRELLASYKGGF